MYSKELKKRFKDFVLRRAVASARYGYIRGDMWECVFYLQGMAAALAITQNFDDYFNVDSESFRYVYNSLVEYRKGVH